MDPVDLYFSIQQTSWTLVQALLSLGLEQDPPVKPLADAIIDLQLLLRNMTLTYGHHVYKYWKQKVSVMIKKKPGLFLHENYEPSISLKGSAISYSD